MNEMYRSTITGIDANVIHGAFPQADDLEVNQIGGTPEGIIKQITDLEDMLIMTEASIKLLEGSGRQPPYEKYIKLSAMVHELKSRYSLLDAEMYSLSDYYAEKLDKVEVAIEEWFSSHPEIEEEPELISDYLADLLNQSDQLDFMRSQFSGELVSE